MDGDGRSIQLLLLSRKYVAPTAYKLTCAKVRDLAIIDKVSCCWVLRVVGIINHKYVN
jgi:hypothetical protein